MIIGSPPPEYNKYENAKNLREGLETHIYVVAEKALARFGNIESIDALDKILGFNEVVRFPTSIVFDDENLDKGEPVKVERLADASDERYTIFIDPLFMEREKDIVALALYSIVKINYGKIAKVKEAELFASLLLGINQDEYHKWYDKLKSEILT